MGIVTVSQVASEAKNASISLAGLKANLKNKVLIEMAEAIENNIPSILKANITDLEFAKNENIPAPLVSRLALNENKVLDMVKGIRSVINLPDPVGHRTMAMEMAKDLILYRETCPIGVIGAIFESRPDAVSQISSLCLKSGNAVVLKGGSEAQNSNKIIVSLIQKAIKSIEGVPDSAIQMIETRSEVEDMLLEEKNIQLIIPRGSNDFVRYIQDNTRIPVLGHSEGICHIYIDDEADLEMAVEVSLDSKIQYPAACNALETLLVNEAVASKVLPILVGRCLDNNVVLLGCQETRRIISEMEAASAEDWDKEYTDLRLSIKLVSSLEEAISLVNEHGSGHTDSIITENKDKAERFLNGVDSASVMVNASTRFADGFRFGLGAEIGISTNKTHARGPVGLEGLVIYKYKLYGNGQTVSRYSGDNGLEFTHRRLD